MEVPSPFSTKSNNPLKQLEDSLAELAKKLPHLPQNVQEIFAKYGPYLILISAIGSTLSVLSMIFGINGLRFIAYYSPGGGVWGYYWTVLILGTALTALLQIIGLQKGLLKQTRAGWQFAFYASLINIVSTLLLTYFVNALVGGAISLYLLFEIREYFK
jgi:hypothetical protein